MQLVVCRSIVEVGYPSTRAVNSASGNRALYVQTQELFSFKQLQFKRSRCVRNYNRRRCSNFPTVIHKVKVSKVQGRIKASAARVLCPKCGPFPRWTVHFVFLPCLLRLSEINNSRLVKPGFHYPSSRPEFTGRFDGP